MHSYLTYLFIFILIFLALNELYHHQKANSPLKLKFSQSGIKDSKGALDLDLEVEIRNVHKRMEVMVPDFHINTVLIGGTKNNQIEVTSSILTNHNDQENREDNYWQAYIVKANKRTKVNINLNLKKDPGIKESDMPKCIWVEIEWSNYGPFGILKRSDGALVPLERRSSINNLGRKVGIKNGISLYPIKTHLLGILDNPINICREYLTELIKPGDILAIGETPLAVMQGRYINPKIIKIQFLAKLLCKSFHPTSSLATACGMQTLIDQVGPTRVLISWIFGAVFKLIGIKGVFYRLAGEQARLIDDITGTTPPYDKTIVLGPLLAHRICKEISKDLGINVAVVDVNDLGRVKILASSDVNIESILKLALITNPAGNANEQTPLVLVRPS